MARRSGDPRRPQAGRMMHSRYFAMGLLLLACSTASAEAAGQEELRARLEAVLALDQKYRGGTVRQRWSEVAAAQTAIDQTNLVIVERLVAEHGWPRISEVGEEAALAAFLVIQHADLATQERYLPLIRARVAENEAKGAWLALITDRILIRQGKPQLYGTQYRADPDTGKTEPFPIADPANVDARRIELGMKPLKPRAKQ